MMRRALVPMLIAAAAVPAALAAQTWRTLDAARQVRDSQPMSVHVAYGAGRIRVQPAPAKTLYDIHYRYDAERSEPKYSFDASTRRLELGMRQTSMSQNMRGGEGSELMLQLARNTPMRLELDVGAAEGDFDLSGLRIEELSLQTGATETHIRFTEPNPARMRTLRLQIGAAGTELTGLGNANVEHIEVNLGVGKAELEFGGEWRGDADVSVTSALGQVVLRIPNDVGIRIESSSFLHSVDAPGMTKRDGYSVSSNWDTAKYKLRLRSSGALGKLEILRIAR